MGPNAGSIRGTQRTPLATQAWGESTRRLNTLYLHVFDWPKDRKLLVGGVDGDIGRAFLLAGGAPVAAERVNLADIVIALPAHPPDPADSVVALEMVGNVGGDAVRLLSTTQDNVLGAFDARVSPALRFTDGKAPHAYVYEWTRTDQSVTWPARLNSTGEFEVWARYSTGTPEIHGKFAIEAGTQRVEGEIEPTAKDTEPREVRIGVLKVPAGQFNVRVVPVKIEGEELIRLFSVTLKPR
jgi:hypothetical protein